MEPVTVTIATKGETIAVAVDSGEVKVTRTPKELEPTSTLTGAESDGDKFDNDLWTSSEASALSDGFFSPQKKGGDSPPCVLDRHIKKCGKKESKWTQLNVVNVKQEEIPPKQKRSPVLLGDSSKPFGSCRAGGRRRVRAKRPARPPPVTKKPKLEKYDPNAVDVDPEFSQLHGL